jgi:nitroreductase
LSRVKPDDHAQEFEMYQSSMKVTSYAQTTNGPATILVTLVGVAAALAVASIQALPLVLTSMGFGSVWIEGLSGMAAENRTPLLYIGAVGLAIGAVMLWFQQQAVHESYERNPDASPALRTLTFLGLAVGAILLLAGASCA